MGAQNLAGTSRKGHDPLQPSGLANSETGEKDPEKGCKQPLIGCYLQVGDRCDGCDGCVGWK